MDSFSAARRDLLKLSGLGLAGAAAPLAAFAQNTPQTAHPGTSIPFFNVRTFGATGDGKTLDTPAINQAITAAAAAGGGTVVFPAGTYLCFSIRLQSLVHLSLAQGAVILAADSPLPGATTGYNGGAYDPAEPNTAWDAFQDYGHNHWHNSLLWGESLHDLSITGPGLIHGRGLSHGGENAPRGAGNRAFKAEQPGVGNKAIALKNCRNVIFRDLSILKAGHFGLLLTGVDNLTIDNLRIDTDRDGMDIDCCKNVRVSNCTVNSPWDDGICPKSSFALGYARPTEDLTVTNCFVTGCYELGSVLDGTFRKFAPDAHVPRTGRIKFGTESNGGFRNVTVSNCVFEGCQGLALETVDGALFEDIAISNITMRDVNCPIFLRLGSRLRGPKDSTRVGTLRRISINNLVAYNSESTVCSTFSGIPGFPIEDLRLSDIFIHHKGGASPDLVGRQPPELESKYPEPGMFGPMPAHGLFFRHIRNLDLSHIELQPAAPDLRPAIYLSDVDRADLLAITAPISPQSPAFTLHNVRDLRIMLSRAAKDTTLAFVDNQSL